MELKFWRNPATGTVHRAVAPPSPEWVEVDPLDHIPTQRRPDSPVRRAMDFGTPAVPMRVQLAEETARSRAVGNVLAAAAVIVFGFMSGLVVGAWWLS